ncbi:membrane bound lytic murein transglycosylase D [Legionella spiritensis]|uniref:Membrane bound lytic murein transglycosylase D n=1 Tax=Legionella spiritensis TaxID=452 RepID=A0A0W0Z974_LEGSP|nr:membrane bound lytic murein transglycosylase D [Legionella spiritensis]SNV35807.1 membrane bound lytic murein transglycosylase D [Legionella spiritensis]
MLRFISNGCENKHELFETCSYNLKTKKGLSPDNYLVHWQPIHSVQAVTLKVTLSLLARLFICFLISYGGINPAYSRSVPSVWDVLRNQFQLNHETTQPEVQAQIRWIVAHPSYLQYLAKAEPYIYHITTEIKKRKLPGELALIPMIESTFDPFAYSGAGAAGLWQLMPGTGTTLGLKQDWWFDARRSIQPSTDAALNYLAYLNKFFHGDWILAIAAYDSGEGTISRAVKSSGRFRNVRFWNLRVPNETRAYVPRLLALAEVIKYPQRYHVKLPDIPHTPYFEEVNIGSQIDLNHAAKMAGMTYKELIQLNPGYNRWATAPYKPYKLLIPTDKVAKFNRNLAHVPEEKRVSWMRHQVQKGESLSAIASRYFTTVKLIRELNRLRSEKLKTGQFLLIPSSKNTTLSSSKQPVIINAPAQETSGQPYKVVHIVQSGETYKNLEKKYNVSVAEISNWNVLDAKMPLRKGQQLIIWKKTPKAGVYIVKAGDSLSRIAKQFNSKVSTLKRLNPHINITLIHPGQRLIIG